jgi:hypothetical protein
VIVNRVITNTIIRGNDQAVNYLARLLDAMSIPQKEAGSLCKLSGICGLGDATAEQEERSDRDG